MSITLDRSGSRALLSPHPVYDPMYDPGVREIAPSAASPMGGPRRRASGDSGVPVSAALASWISFSRTEWTLTDISLTR